MPRSVGSRVRRRCATTLILRARVCVCCKCERLLISTLVRLLSSGSWLLPRGHHSTLTPPRRRLRLRLRLRLKLKVFSVRRRTSQQRFRSFAIAQRPRDDARPPTHRPPVYSLCSRGALTAGLVPCLCTRTLPIAALDLPLTAVIIWLSDLTSEDMRSFRRISN